MPDMTSVDFNGLYCLFKGEPGTRKSTTALSFPKPIYFFSFDQKMEGIAIPMKKWGIDPKEIQYDDYHDWNAALKKLRDFQVKCPFKTVVIDSITSCADAINRQTLAIKGNSKGISTDEKGKVIAGIPVNSIEDFNAEDSALKELIAVTKDIRKYHKVNIILIAHVIQTEQKNPGGQVTHISRSLLTAGKKIAAKLPAYCGEVYHFNVMSEGMAVAQGGKYGLFTVHMSEDFARTALPLDEKIVFNDEPLYEKWIKPAMERMAKDGTGQAGSF
jgi:hypothetical protein